MQTIGLFKRLSVPLVSVVMFMCGVFFVVPASAQKPIHKIYTHKNGLPSNDVKTISQDNLGYIWFLNGDGITRFDGTEFKYTFLGNHFYGRMYQDHLGRVWLHGSAMFRHVDQLKYCYDGEIHTYAHNDVLDSLATVIFSFLVDEDENIWVGLSREAGDGRPCFIRISPEGKVRKYYVDLPADDRTIVSMKVGDNCLHAVQAPAYKEINAYKLWVIDGQDTTITAFPETHELRPYYRNERLLFVTRHLGVLELKDGQLVAAKPKKPHGFPFGYLDTEGRFLIPAMDNGLLCYHNMDFEKEPTSLLNNVHFCSVFQSRDGSYWFGTRDKGLYYIPSFDIQTFDTDFGLPNNLISDIQITDSSLWITYRKGLSQIRLGRGKLRPENYEFGGYLTGSYLYRDSLMFLGGVYDVNVPEEFPYEVLKWPAAKGMRPSVRGLLSYTSGHCLHTWYGVENSRRKTFLIGDFPKSHLQMGYGHFLYSDMGGLKRYRGLAVSPLGQYDTLLKKPVYAIEPIGKKWMLLASEVYGVIAMKDSAHLFAINKAQGLSGNICKNLCLDTDSTFWAVTENGLDHVRYSVREDTVLFDVLWQFGGEYGIAFVDALHLRISKDDVWLASMNSVLRISKGLYDETEPPLKPIVENVYLSGTRMKNIDSLHFSYTSGATDFEITSPYFTAPNELRFKYRLGTSDAVWKTTDKRRFSLEGIGPGKHTLNIVAINRRGVESETKEFQFQVDPIFWQTYWFKTVGIVLILLSGIYYGYKKREQLVKRRRLLNEIKTYKNTALRLQMNPHFVYNSLGSIQSFVLKQESKVSSKYIAKLSRLMRLIFDHNNRELISLKDELEVLALYVDLEFLRHDQALKYELTVSPALVPENIMIPPMLLQPLVENAILHGLVPQSGLGIISVAVAPRKSGLEFVISDNGTGIRFSGEEGARKTRRSGGVITSDRVALFNRQQGYQGFFKLDEQNSFGTRISFSLPLIALE